MCHVTIYVISPSPNNGTDNNNNYYNNWSSISINGSTAYRWRTTSNCVIVSLDLSCNLLEAVSFPDRVHSYYGLFSQYVQDLPNKTILAGVCYGKSRHSSVLVDLGIPMRLVAGLGKDRGIVTFVGWKGYPGHTRYRLTPGGNTVNQLSTKFVVGKWTLLMYNG